MKGLKIVGIGVFLLIFCTGTAFAAFPFWGSKGETAKKAKPGKSTLISTQQERNVTSKLGRGSDYMSRINPTPLKFGEEDHYLGTQY